MRAPGIAENGPFCSDNIFRLIDGEDGYNADCGGFKGNTKEQCLQIRGNRYACGSPCAATDSEICLQVCSAQCECEGIAGFGCPEGFKCRLAGTIADEMGVCIRK